MKKAIVLLALLIVHFTVSAQKSRKNDAYEILVVNTSKFDIKCFPGTDKDEGDFAASAQLLRAGETFLFRVMKSAGGILPKGVEGDIKFRLENPNYLGYGQVHFNDPVVGGPEFSIVNSDWPITIKEMTVSETTDYYTGFFVEPASYIKISVDTSHTRIDPVKPTLTGSTSSTDLIPPIINFDWKVTQRMHKDPDDDDANNGKAYREVTYLFTTKGDYAAVKPDDASFDLMIYSPKGQTWIMDDKKKTITVMNMPKTVGEGALMGKAVAEHINKGPLKREKDEEFTITKTGKTKKILGYTAYEYELRNATALSTKNAKPNTASFWYADVPFDPVKVYTMGAGRPADISKLQNDPRMKNNITAIPVLNKNYLQAEMEAGNIKGVETTEIKHVNTTIYTAGYKVKEMKGLKDMIKKDDDN